MTKHDERNESRFTYAEEQALNNRAAVVEPCGRIWVVRAECSVPDLNDAKIETVSLRIFSLETSVDSGRVLR